MKKHKFSKSERIGVFEAHDGRCGYCGDPCDPGDWNVDHVLPECLLENDSERHRVVRMYGLPVDFDLNTFENWAPLHPKCNRSKSGKVFDGQPIILSMIEKAIKLGPSARARATRAITSRELQRATNYLKRAAENGALTRAQIEEISAQLLTIASPDHVSFLLQVAEEALDRGPKSSDAFFKNGVSYNVATSFNITTQKIESIATARANIDILGIGSVDVSLRVELRWAGEPKFVFSIGKIEMEPFEIYDGLERPVFRIDLTNDDNS